MLEGPEFFMGWSYSNTLFNFNSKENNLWFTQSSLENCRPVSFAVLDILKDKFTLFVHIKWKSLKVKLWTIAFNLNILMKYRKLLMILQTLFINKACYYVNNTSHEFVNSPLTIHIHILLFVNELFDNCIIICVIFSLLCVS